MKRYSLIILAFALLLGFTQCKPEPEDNPDDSRMIPVRFELPIDNGAKTNFDDFFIINKDSTSVEIGTIKWDNNEVVYLPVPYKLKKEWNDDWGVAVAVEIESTPEMLELTGTNNGGSIVFKDELELSVVKLLLNKTIHLYYLGNGTNVKEIHDNVNYGYGIEFSFRNQTGEKGDLNKLHYATIEVLVRGKDSSGNSTSTPTQVNSVEFELINNNNVFSNEFSICYLDLEAVGELNTSSFMSNNGSNAIPYNAVRISCPYTTDPGEAEGKSFGTKWFNDVDRGIIVNPEPEKKGSFIVLPYSSTTLSGDLKCNKGTYTFGLIEKNTVYYGKGVENNKIEPLPWTPNP